MHKTKTEINLISREYDKLSLSIVTVHQNLEIWRGKEQTIRENYGRMEHKLAAISKFKEKTKSLEKQKHVILSEEPTVIKKENK